MILLDSITRLARLQQRDPAPGKAPRAVDANHSGPNAFRCRHVIKLRGSLTIIASLDRHCVRCRNDEVIFEEFKGTGNSGDTPGPPPLRKAIPPSAQPLGHAPRGRELCCCRPRSRKNPHPAPVHVQAWTNRDHGSSCSRQQATKTNVEFFDMMRRGGACKSCTRQSRALLLAPQRAKRVPPEGDITIEA